MTVYLVRRETLGLVGAEQAVRDEHGALANSRVRDQLGVDPDGDV